MCMQSQVSNSEATSESQFGHKRIASSSQLNHKYITRLSRISNVTDDSQTVIGTQKWGTLVNPSCCSRLTNIDWLILKM